MTNPERQSSGESQPMIQTGNENVGPDGNGNDHVDGRRTTPSSREMNHLNKHETTSQGILEVVGLQQTVNIAVIFVKAKIAVNYLYYVTAVTIIVSIVAQVLLASLVVTKIWIRKCANDKKKGKDKTADTNNDNNDDNYKQWLRKLDFITLLLVLIITVLTTILLAISGMIEARPTVEDRSIN